MVAQVIQPEDMVNMGVGIYNGQRLQVCSTEVISKFFMFRGGMTTWIYNQAGAIVVADQVGVFLKRIKGEGV